MCSLHCLLSNIIVHIFMTPRYERISRNSYSLNWILICCNNEAKTKCIGRDMSNTSDLRKHFLILVVHRICKCFTKERNYLCLFFVMFGLVWSMQYRSVLGLSVQSHVSFWLILFCKWLILHVLNELSEECFKYKNVTYGKLNVWINEMNVSGSFLVNHIDIWWTHRFSHINIILQESK